VFGESPSRRSKNAGRTEKDINVVRAIRGRVAHSSAAPNSRADRLQRRDMHKTLHITSGDSAGDGLTKCGLPGEVFVWRDILYDGPRSPGWPDDGILRARALFLEQTTAGGLDRTRILEALRNQYSKLAAASAYECVVLWFDACLFDQSMLAHILTCLRHQGVRDVDLLCVDAFPGIEPFHGLGQLQPDQLALVYGDRRPVTDSEFRFAALVDKAFATQDSGLLSELSQLRDAPVRWIPAAIARWMQEQPHPVTGLGQLERLALDAIRAGCETPREVFTSVAAADTPPQFWGDTTLWAKINALADRSPPLVRIDGPGRRLPQWGSDMPLADFRITTLPNPPFHATAGRGA